MIIEVKIPSPGESITEVSVANWLVKDGDYVDKNQELAEIESDKATLPLISPETGQIKFIAKENETIKVGSVACTIDTNALSEKKETVKPNVKEEKKNKHETRPASEAAKIDTNIKKEVKGEISEKEIIEKTTQPEIPSSVKVTPLAKSLIEENNLSIEDILNGLKKITTREVNLVLGEQQSGVSQKEIAASRNAQRSNMSQLRKKLSNRLVAVKNQTAMLTTFNEVDMSAIMSLRKKYQDAFKEKHGIKLGIMSLFVKASSVALKMFPKINSMIEGDEIITPEYVDVCIAVQTGKGLMVPVIKNTEVMTIAQIEFKIAELAEKAKTYKISIEEMTGGTFTITNGGVFGSMLSTPIINPPQSAILGMHNIVDRPIAIDGNVVIRPVMYLALSYDHRLIDGAESVSFLVKIKELIENPANMLFEGDMNKLLLGI